MAKTYTVIDVTESVQVTKEGEILKINRVIARTTSGSRFTIEVPSAESTPEKVSKLLEARARDIDLIRGIVGDDL